MIPGWLRCILGMAVSLLPGAALAADAADVERWTLIDGRTVGPWVAVESTLSLAAAKGEDAFLFHVPIDWSAGEENYPVGWPRIQMRVPDASVDWRRWEQLRLRVYAPAEGDPLPAEPIGISLGTGDHHSSWGRSAAGLRRGDWMEFAFDLSDVPDRDRVHSICVFVSEEAYPDGATLRFYVSGLELVRYLKPTLMELASVPAVAFADAAAVPFEVKMLGVEAGGSARVEMTLRRGDTVVARTAAPVAQGATAVTLRLPPATPPGLYALVVRLGEKEITENIRLIASPWQEAAR